MFNSGMVTSENEQTHRNSLFICEHIIPTGGRYRAASRCDPAKTLRNREWHFRCTTIGEVGNA